MAPGSRPRPEDPGSGAEAGRAAARPARRAGARGRDGGTDRGGGTGRGGDRRPPRLTVGLVRGLRGLRGQVRIELLTDRPEDRFAVGAVLFPEGATRGLTIEESSAVADGPGWWLRFREVRDRSAAEALRDVYLEIEPPDEPREPGRWFWHELEGVAVRGSDGSDLGRIVEVYRAGGAEVFLVRGPRGELDVPAVRGIVLDLAPDRGEMVVDMDALALDARPVDDEDYVRPRDRRPANPKRPSAPKAATAPRGATGTGTRSTDGPPAKPPRRRAGAEGATEPSAAAEAAPERADAREPSSAAEPAPERPDGPELAPEGPDAPELPPAEA